MHLRMSLKLLPWQPEAAKSLFQFLLLDNCDCPCENLYKRSANANAFVSNAVRSTGNEGERTKV